jgi:hypothetical protein
MGNGSVLIGWKTTIFGGTRNETFEKCPILVKVKEGDNFNGPREICFAFHRAGRNILNISRINPPQVG